MSRHREMTSPSLRPVTHCLRLVERKLQSISVFAEVIALQPANVPTVSSQHSKQRDREKLQKAAFTFSEPILTRSHNSRRQTLR
jgi:hypothetical protein